MEKTLFSKIIDGEIPCHKVYEDEASFAFLDINPVHPGHTLVVPKTPAKDVFEISEEDWSAVMKTVHTLAPKIQAATGADGINIVMSNGEHAGQEVFHAHVHIIPRFAGDKRFSHWQSEPYQEGEAEVVLEKIASQF